jgi:hypothetical protein
MDANIVGVRLFFDHPISEILDRALGLSTAISARTFRFLAYFVLN